MRMPRWRSAVLRLMLMLALTPAVARAQSKPELQMQQDIRMLQEQIAQLRVAVNAIAEQQKAANARIDSQTDLLRTNSANQADTLRNLQGQVDALAGKIALYSQQVGQFSSEISPIRRGLEDQQKKIDRILSAVEVQSPTAPGDVNTGTPVTSGASLPASPQAAFNQARGFYFQGEWELAVKALEEFLKSPDATNYAGDANYWLGMSYFKIGKYDKAMAAFKNVIDNYKTSDKVAESYYNMGESLAALGRPKEAQAAYNDTIKLFPDSPAASLAKTRIK